ncbi:TNR14 factor, partial [Sapayoa aenigma]|nr:TNR14 factor [Sapayoa aenigma]
CPEVVAVVLLTLLERSGAVSCELDEYSTGTECCPMCPAGLRVLKHCTASSSTTCTPCVKGTYTAHPNGLPHCMPCKQCDKGANLMTEAACTYTSNTECGCRPEHFCSSLGPEGCELCQPYTVCVPGTVVKQWGNKTKDNVCEVCPPGTSSTASMSETCTPQLRSRHHNYFFSRIRLEEQDPSPALPVPAIVAILVSAVTLAVAAAVTYIWQRRRRKSYMPRKYGREKHGQALMSTEEKWDQTTVPVQEIGADPEEIRAE